jgi:hypothetical protein
MTKEIFSRRYHSRRTHFLLVPVSRLGEKFVNGDDPSQLLVRVYIQSEALGIIPAAADSADPGAEIG